MQQYTGYIIQLGDWLCHLVNFCTNKMTMQNDKANHLAVVYYLLKETLQYGK